MFFSLENAVNLSHHGSSQKPRHLLDRLNLTAAGLAILGQPVESEIRSWGYTWPNKWYRLGWYIASTQVSQVRSWWLHVTGLPQQSTHTHKTPLNNIKYIYDIYIYIILYIYILYSQVCTMILWDALQLLRIIWLPSVHGQCRLEENHWRSPFPRCLTKSTLSNPVYDP